MDTGLNAGDTAWILIATGLVLMMTIPGLALFYGGAVRSKNVLSIAMQCFAISGLVTVLWILYGYSLCFSGGENKLIGDLSKAALAGVGVDSLSGTIPEPLFATFQATFAIITCALIVGAVAERAKFSALLIFMGLWLTLVYLPICHWVWGGGWLGAMGILDFAGGAVVHVNAGIAGLVYCLMLGRRKGYPGASMRPNNLVYTLIGASLLWVGWFGFNGGSALAADGTAAMAILVTQIAAAAAAMAWMACEWLRHGKPTAFGIASGAISGLVAITPASGFVGPIGALAIGATAGVVCYLAAVTIKMRIGYDDSLDVFGVHAVGGAVGALLTGIFAAPMLGGAGFGEGIESIGGQVLVQAVGIAATVIYCAALSWVCLKLTSLLCDGLRVNTEEETEGLDLVLHDERGYNL